MKKIVSLFVVFIALTLRSAHAGVAWESVPVAEVSDRTLHVVCVGINDYDLGERGAGKLNWARADAEELGAAFEQRGKNEFSDVKARVLLGDDASKTNVSKAILAVASQAKPQDTFVFCFAGYDAHVLGEGDDGLLLAGSNQNPRAASLSTEELRFLCERIAARNQMLFLDTCFSANVSQGFESSFLRQNAASDALAGRSFFTLSTQGVAIEDPKLKHGELTFAVLRALNGEADYDDDRRVSSDELAAFVPAFLKSQKLKTQARILQQGEPFVLLAQAPQKPKRHGVKDFISGILEGNTSSLSDRIEPQIVLSSPEMLRGAPRLEVSEALLEVAGRAFDAGGIQTVSVNGQEVSVRPNGEFRAQLPVEPGETRVQVEAVDRAGNKNSQSFVVNRATPNAPLKAEKARKGRDYALLFATDTYADAQRWPRLSNPIFDAEALANVLETKYGFDLGPDRENIHRNLGREEIQKVFAQWNEREFAPDDQLFVFFAGHGVFSPDAFNEGFLIPANAAQSDAPPFYNSCLPYTRLSTWIDNLGFRPATAESPAKKGCRHIFVVLDACFGGTFSQKLAQEGTDLARNAKPRLRLAELDWGARPRLWRVQNEEATVSQVALVRRELKRPSRLFLTSGGKEYVSDGKPGAHSPFARQLLAVLRTGGQGGVLTALDVVSNMKRLPTEPQNGTWGRDGGGGFVFVEK